MGIAPILVERIYETIAEINRQGTTILLVEQNANFALGVSDRGYVLETGTVALATSRRRCATTPRSRGRTWAHDRPRRHRRHGALPAVRLAGSRRSRASYLSDRKGYGEKAGPRHRPAAVRRRRCSSGCSWPPRAGIALEDGGPYCRLATDGCKGQSSPQARSPPTAREAPVPGISVTADDGLSASGASSRRPMVSRRGRALIGQIAADRRGVVGRRVALPRHRLRVSRQRQPHPPSIATIAGPSRPGVTATEDQRAGRLRHWRRG